MLDSLELPVFPSCYNCISWSEDGEIAVAAGEYVQILTPKSPSGREVNSIASHFSSKDWHTTRVRVNVFTVNEWPLIFPQPRDQFSLGPEQSTSTVVGVAWSPPGLTKFRRSILAVLTSNLVLSLYACIGTQGKWTRIAIVNKSLESYLHRSNQSSTPRGRNIRAFTWTPPLKLPAQNQLNPGPESRWGVFILSVVSDDNNVAFVQVQLLKSQQGPSESWRLEVVSTVCLHDLGAYDQLIQPESVLASAVRSQGRTLSLASGPWRYRSQGSEVNGEGPWSAVVNVAGIQETKLMLVKLSVVLVPRTHVSETEPPYELSFNAVQNTAMSIERMANLHYTGPMFWTETGFGRIALVVGAVAGLALMNLSENTYNGQNPENEFTDSHYYPIFETSMDGIEQTGLGHYERIGGLTVAFDAESETPMIHLGTVGGYAKTMPLLHSVEANDLSQAPWKVQVDDIREQFDIDRDLGGLAVSRIWGLSSIQGLVAAAITMHPGDMVEYRTNAEDRLTIVFSTANGQPANPEYVPFLRGSPITSTEFLRERRDVVLRYILYTVAKQTISPKILYAAASCAIIQSQNLEVLSYAQNVLESLAAACNVDLTDEISKCSASGSTIDAKSAEQLNASHGNIFERCEVCDTGIAWNSPQEAQCATGHVFVRCNMTFLAIQEPGVSKFCSKCGSEYLDEDLIAFSAESDIQQACKSLSEAFDTCIYCDGKFRP